MEHKKCAVLHILYFIPYFTLLCFMSANNLVITNINYAINNQFASDQSVPPFISSSLVSFNF